MKNSASVISHLMSQPLYEKKIGLYHCLHKIERLLSPTLARHIAYLYLYQETLVFVLKHPGAKMEVDYKLTQIKSILNYNTIPECQTFRFSRFQSRLLPSALTPYTIEKKTSFHAFYKERSSGEFLIQSDIPFVIEHFTKIQSSIKKNASNR